MPNTYSLTRLRKLPTLKRIGKYLSAFFSKMRTAPQAILLVVLGLSLLFSGQAAQAAAEQVDNTWNIIRKADGQVVCTLHVAHEGEPTIAEIAHACGNVPASEWQDGKFRLVQVSPTATPSVVLHSWMETPATVADLQTNRPLTYLAGKMIAAGYVDVSACNGSALLENGSASPCGLEAARPFVFVWQNRFDPYIFNAAAEQQIPAFMFKNLLIQESQMWPQASRHSPPEYGMGQLTENGADTLLMWNNGYFRQICREALDKSKCEKDYLSITASERAFLRGVTLIEVRADCSTCPVGLDLKVAAESIPVFASAIRANFNQIDQIAVNLTGKRAVNLMEIQEVWKLAAANYHAGPGCTSNAMRATLKVNDPLRWKNISKHFGAGCESAIKYVDAVTNMDDSLEIPPVDRIEAAIRIINGLPPLTSTPTLTIDPGTIITATPTADVNASPTSEIGPGTNATPTVDVNASPTSTLDPASTATPTPTVDVNASPTSTLDPASTATPTPTLEATATQMPLFPVDITPVVIDQSVQQQLASPHVQNEVLIKIDPQNRADAVEALRSIGINLKLNSDPIDSLSTLVVNVPASQLASALTALQNINGIEFVEPNYLVEMAGTPNDPGFSQQNNLWVIQAPQTWDALPTMQEVLVAVIDTGVDVNHPDLANSIWQNAGETGQDANGSDKRTNGLDDDANGYVDDWQGWNMIAGNNDVSDNQGHGTHLAGIIGAQMNNSLGIVGVAPNARILPIKALDNNGFGTYAQVAEGIVYATKMGARVINLGFGGTGSSQLLQDAIDYAAAHGVLVVAAAGNGGTNVPYYPAAYSGVIAVSAVDNNLSWATFSSSGDHISLTAPGIGIYSTIPGGSYATYSGTSMSSAEVSGVAALLAGQPQFSDPNLLRSALLGSAYDLGLPGRDPYFGYGLVHALDALAYAGPILPTPTPWIVPTSTPGGVGGVYAMAAQDLWGFTQSSTYAITNPANSIDKTFNDLLASSTGPFGASSARSWIFTAIDDTSLTAVASVDLDLRFYMTGWVNDSYAIQVFDNTNPACALGWCTVYTLKFNPLTSTEGQPPSTLTTLSIPVTTILNTVTRVNNAQVRIAGAGAALPTDNVTIYIDEVRLRVLDTLPPTATPTSTPVFIPTATLPASRWMTATPLANEPHNNFMSATVDECAACHRSHTAKGFALRSNTGEEQVCFACHNADVQPAFTAKTNTLTRFFSHGVSTYTNIHFSTENAGGYFGGANRHVECEDCHSPHSASRTDPSGFVSAPSIQQQMYNSSGVDPDWTVAGAPNSYTLMTTAGREYQVCFKCHSSYTTLPTYNPDGYQAGVGYVANGLFKLGNSAGAQVADSRDLAKEFNSYQVSFHPVAALGRNRNMSAGSFVAGWSQDSMTYCSDCHQTANAPANGEGPHGSSLLHILDGSTEYITKIDPNGSCPGGCPSIHDSGELCFKCHQYGTYATGTNPVSTTHFANGIENLHAFHSFGSCYTCHDTHGSEQAHLINFDTSVVTINPGYTSQSAWQFNSAIGTGTCFVACHDGAHGSGTSYTP